MKYFRENKIPFKEINVERDPERSGTCRGRPASGVPVIKIGGKWIVGFDKPAIERELTRS